MKPFICNCGAKKGKHRRDHWCDVWEASGSDDTLEEWDIEPEDQYNDPRHEIRVAMPTEGSQYE